MNHYGCAYSGWQTQKHLSLQTVQEVLEKALSQVVDEKIKVVCAGRTDAGVHATGQVVNFSTANVRPEKAFIRGCNSLLPDDIAVKWALPVTDDFHARFSAQARRYRYIIDNNPVRSAIMHGLVTPVYRQLNENEMHNAAQLLLGENDFSAYRGAGCQSKTPMRNLMHCDVSRHANFVLIDIRANAFLLHMVRNIAGVLIDIGQGLKPVSWAGEVLQSVDRTQAGITAPPDGLYLVEVTYPEAFQLPNSQPGPDFIDQ